MPVSGRGPAARGWDPSAPCDDPRLRWVAATLVPNLRRTSDEIANLLAARAATCPPAPAAPTRGGAHVLPTGRNFYSVDPQAVPSPLAWDVGRALADRLVERHLADTGTYPRTVGLVVWGRPTCAPRATTWPRSSRCWACARSGTTTPAKQPGPGAGAAERACAPGRRDRADLGVLRDASSPA